MANDLITAQIIIFRRRKFKGGCRKVVDPPAADAAEMVVLGRIGIEAGLAAGMLFFLDQAHPRQQVQITVDRAQADPRQPPPDKLVEFHRRRVGSNRLQFLKNHLPLPGFAALAARLPARRLGERRARREGLSPSSIGSGT